MKEVLFHVLAVYLLLLLIAATVGNIERIYNQEHCGKVLMGDYFFLGLTRLACEVK